MSEKAVRIIEKTSGFQLLDVTVDGRVLGSEVFELLVFQGGQSEPLEQARRKPSRRQHE